MWEHAITPLINFKSPLVDVHWDVLFKGPLSAIKPLLPSLHGSQAIINTALKCNGVRLMVIISVG